jgi:hypothetical protein
MNKNLFAALQLEKLALFIIVTIIVLVAAFAIVGHLVLLVAEKRKEIGILKAMGASAGHAATPPALQLEPVRQALRRVAMIEVRAEMIAHAAEDPRLESTSSV